MRLFLLAFFMGLVLACEPQEKERSSAYYPLGPTLEQSIESLSGSAFKLKKIVAQNQQLEEKVLLKPNWETELGFLGDVHINKPAFANAYFEEVQGGKTTYTLKPKQKEYPIQELELFFDQDGEMEKVEARTVEKNPLYLEEKMYLIEFISGPQSITHYRILSLKKVSLGSPDSMRIEGWIF